MILYKDGFIYANQQKNIDIAYNGDEGEASADSRFGAFMLCASNFDLIRIITYDLENDSILGTLETNIRPDFVDISPSGEKVLCSFGWNGSGDQYDGPHVFNLDFSNPIKVGNDTLHSGWGYDVNGNEVYVAQNSSTDWITMVNIDTGESSQIYYHGDMGWGLGFHFSRTYLPQNKGWIVMSTYENGEAQKWGQDQLFMLELKDRSNNPRVWRLAHT